MQIVHQFQGLNHNMFNNDDVIPLKVVEQVMASVSKLNFMY